MRELDKGMGEAVAKRTVLRTIEGKTETWADVADRVAAGNVSLAPGGLSANTEEFKELRDHIANGRLLMSGRHLQHGDMDQKYRNMEVFTNCGHRDTTLLTQEYGTTTLGEVAGQSVTVRCSDGKWRVAEAKEYGTQELNEIVFRRSPKTGPALRITERFTANHRWILEDGTVTEDIQVGDRLLPAVVGEPTDPQAVVHGIVFGDGTAHKSRRDADKMWVSQGRTYASIRVCKQDTVRDDIHHILDGCGYSFTTPDHAQGDRCYYIGKFPFAKELPHTRDGEYISSFIHGWWLADGSKTEYRKTSENKTITITTADETAAHWLVEHAPYAGLTVLSHKVKERKANDGSYTNGKPLHTVRMRQGVVWEVEQILPLHEDVVYCVEEPVTKSFTLGSGMVTGNCATAATSALSFHLLLNGSGVGRCYDDDMMVVDWDQAPNLVLYLDSNHKDSLPWGTEGFDHFHPKKKELIWEVEDSREGWAKALEIYETMAYNGESDKVLVLDFSNVRPSGAPIRGMQNRPSSGPVPTMQAFKNIRDNVVGKGMPKWKQAMYVDHYMAESVLVGGARRAARIAVKYWKDEDILDYIKIKEGGVLWSANNSVGVDEEFWDYLPLRHHWADKRVNPKPIFDAITEAAYHDGTGEPGFLNLHKLNTNEDGLDWEELKKGEYVGSEKYQVEPEYKNLLGELAGRVENKHHKFIVNPCGEIVLSVLGGFCVIADVVPYHCEDLGEFISACKHAARALIRVNTMDSIYKGEVLRTNRIGVGCTGLHEWAYSHYGDVWGQMSGTFAGLSTASRECEWVAEHYSNLLGVSPPHTVTTIKPAGTTSKLFGLTEGCHLPAMAYYLRWVQFRNDDPIVDEYRSHGYPIKELKTYSGMTAVGFPTKPTITDLMGDKVVTAGEATMEEQFEWLRKLERSWLGPDKGNQLSYTLKYNPNEVDFEEFQAMMLKHVPTVRCVSVMPQIDATAYEYQPEEPITKEEYESYMTHIDAMKEDIGREHLECGSGGCPIDFNEGE